MLDVGDLDPDPITQFRRWLDDVLAAELPEPMAMVLVTTPGDAGSQPLGRHVLLRGVDERGFGFVSNHRSRKGRHLAENPRAALVFPWYPIHRQVIVTGTVAVAPDEESDAYFATRARESQLAAWASEQSEPIPDRAWLERRWADLASEHADGPVPRPPHWGLYRLTPSGIEFWQQGAHRMHDRILFERAAPGDEWSVSRLAP